MAKLKVNWAPDRLLNFEEVIQKQGYFLNAMSGVIYRHVGHPPQTEANVGAIERAAEAGLQPTLVDSRIWLFITDDVDLTEGDVRGMLRDLFHVRMEDQGRLVSTPQPWHRQISSQ
jgi:hypothetical protein